MRNAFAEELTRLADDDERIVLLSGDIGNRLFDDFKDRFPDRFFNCGVAEANMMGVAAGLAAEGFRPIVYTIGSFVTTRCLEQIRDDVCFHNLPVTIVAVGAGLSYAALGATHQSLEDIAFLRALPDMTVVCPADAWEVRALLGLAVNVDRPIYLRLGKKGEPLVHDDVPVLEIGRSFTLREGHDVCIMTTGNMARVALETADLLATRNYSAKVVNMHTVKPLDDAALQASTTQFTHLITIEEHSRIGGFGSAVGEWIFDQGYAGVTLLRFGTQDKFLHEATNQSHARHRHGLTASNISAEILEHLEEPKLGIG